MKVLITASALMIGLAFASAAMACDQEEAEQKWLEGEEAGITLGVGTVQGAPSFAVDVPTWSQLDYNIRVNMMKTFECVVAGPGNILGKAQVITPGGKILAVWDGIDQELEIR